MKFKAHIAEEDTTYRDQLVYQRTGRHPRDMQKAGEMTQNDVQYMRVGKEVDVYEIGSGDKKYAKVVAIFSTIGGGHSITVQLASASGKFDGKKLTYKIIKT